MEQDLQNLDDAEKELADIKRELEEVKANLKLAPFISGGTGIMLVYLFTVSFRGCGERIF